MAVEQKIIFTGDNTKLLSSISSMDASITKLEAKIVALNTSASKGFKDQATAATGLSRELSSTASVAGKLKNSLKFGGGVVKVNKETISLDKSMNRLSASTRKAVAELNRVTDNKIRSLIKSSQKAAKSTSVLGSTIKKIGAAYIAFKTIDVFKKIIKDTIDFQSALVKIKFATGDAAGSIEFLKKTADTFGTSLENSINSFANFAAASKGTAIEGEKLRKIFTGLTAAMAGNRVTADRQKLVLLAVEQMMSKGVVSAEELRRQMGEHLPGAFSIAAKSMGMTTKSFNKLLASGKIMTEDFLPKFTALLKVRFGDAATEQADKAAASFIRLGNAIYGASVAVGESGVVDFFAFLADGLTSTIKIVRTPEVQDILGTMFSWSSIGMALKAKDAIIEFNKTAAEISHDKLVENAVTVDQKKLLDSIDGISRYEKLIKSVRKELAVEQSKNPLPDIIPASRKELEIKRKLLRLQESQNKQTEIYNTILKNKGNILEGNAQIEELAIKKVIDSSNKIINQTAEVMGNINGLDIPSIYGKLFDGGPAKISGFQENIKKIEKAYAALELKNARLASNPIGNKDAIDANTLAMQNQLDKIAEIKAKITDITNTDNNIKLSVDNKAKENINNLKAAVGEVSPEVAALRNKFLELQIQIGAATNPEVIRLLNLEMQQTTHEINVANGIEVASVYGKLFEGGEIRIQKFKDDIQSTMEEIKRLRDGGTISGSGTNLKISTNFNEINKGREKVKNLRLSLKSLTSKQNLIRVRVDNAAEEKIIALRLSVGEITKAQAEAKRETMKFNLEMAKNPGPKLMKLLIKQHQNYIKEAKIGTDILAGLSGKLKHVYENSNSKFQASMTKSLMTGMGSAFNSIEMQFRGMIFNMLKVAQTANIPDAILGSGSRVLSSNDFGGGRAIGGDVARGKQYLVGENGPELFSPGVSGNISKNTGSRVNNIVMNINTPDANSFAVNQRQMIAKLSYDLSISDGRDK